MAVYKETKTNTWRVNYRYTDWRGVKKQSTKRGFATKRDALAWEREQMNKVTADLDMTFESFVDTYTVDMKNRIKENTWQTKEHIIRSKILPYFGNRKINEIQAKDIIAWQNEMIKGETKGGKKYSPVYLKTVHNQLSAINIDTIAVENEVADNMYQRSELDWLIYNAPLEYAYLIFNGDPEKYLKAVTQYKPFEN